MSKRLLPAALFGTLCLPVLGVPQGGVPAPGSVAPSFEGVTWHAADAAHGTVVQQAVSGGGLQIQKPQGNGYPAWYGFPVLVLTLPDNAGADVIAFGELAQRANEDRGLVVVTITKAAPPTPEPDSGGAPSDAQRGEDEAADTPPSSQLVAGRALESSPWCPDAAPRAIVLGPTGEVIGAAYVRADRDEVLELLAVALNRYPAAPLEEDLGEPVREAQSKYFAGDWEAARKLANKLAKSLSRSNPEAAQAALRLAAKVDEHERALRAGIIDANREMYSSVKLAALVAATRRGFPRSAAASEAEAAAALQLKDMGRETAYRVAEEWVEILPSRPALFPDVADARGKKYAKALEALTKRANLSSDLTRHAQSLVLRYELAARR
ncbi:MAG: hypothetical protein R3F49_09600 [Planctomycetota bacterium]